MSQAGWLAVGAYLCGMAVSFGYCGYRAGREGMDGDLRVVGRCALACALWPLALLWFLSAWYGWFSSDDVSARHND